MQLNIKIPNNIKQYLTIDVYLLSIFLETHDSSAYFTNVRIQMKHDFWTPCIDEIFDVVNIFHYFSCFFTILSYLSLHFLSYISSVLIKTDFFMLYIEFFTNRRYFFLNLKHQNFITNSISLEKHLQHIFQSPTKFNCCCSSNNLNKTIYLSIDLRRYLLEI